MNKYTKWFRIALWLGVILDLLLGLPGIFFPNTMLRLLHLRPSTDIVWTATASILTVALALMYTTANDPILYRRAAWNAVIARGLCAIFFLLLWPGYYVSFGVMDLLFFVVQGWFLRQTLQVYDRHTSSTP